LSAFVAGLLFALADAVAPTPPRVNVAWWLADIDATPQAHFRGRAASALPVPLSRFALLSCDASPTFSDEQCAEVWRNRASFARVGDFNRDGSLELAVTGIGIRAADAVPVRFLIISDLDGDREPQMFVHEGSRFSATLIGPDGNLVYAGCMECDSGAVVVWDASAARYRLDYEEHE
jgi:hypothetical protein